MQETTNCCLTKTEEPSGVINYSRPLTLLLYAQNKKRLKLLDSNRMDILVIGVAVKA
jgi:hypothetical protein